MAQQYCFQTDGYPDVGRSLLYIVGGTPVHSARLECTGLRWAADVCRTHQIGSGRLCESESEQLPCRLVRRACPQAAGIGTIAPQLSPAQAPLHSRRLPVRYVIHTGHRFHAESTLQDIEIGEIPRISISR